MWTAASSEIMAPYYAHTTERRKKTERRSDPPVGAAGGRGSAARAALEWITPEDLTEAIALGHDPERRPAAIRRFVDARFDHVVLGGIGPDQQGFLGFWRDELSPPMRQAA
jgi:hypothetical protein